VHLTLHWTRWSRYLIRHPSRLFRFGLKACTLLVFITLCGALTEQSTHGDSGCSVDMSSPVTVRLADGRAVYVNPSAMSASGGRVLLAGVPTLVWPLNAQRVPPADADDSTAIGVVIGSDGKAGAIRVPLDARKLVAVLAVAAGPGTWDVVLGEGRRGYHTAGDDTARRLWHAVVGPQGLHGMELLPLPAGGAVRLASFSSLVRAGSSLVAAGIFETPDRSNDLILYERRRGAWSYTLVPSRRAAYVAVGQAPGSGLLLAVVEPDSTRPRDENALFLWRRVAGEWRRDRKLAPGLPEPVHSPSIEFNGRSVVVSWYAETGSRVEPLRELRALVDPLRDPRLPMLRIDRGITERFAALPGADGAMLWITEHARPEGGSRNIRITMLAGEGVKPIYDRGSSHMRYLFNGTALGASSFAVVGTRTGGEGQWPPVTSELIRARVRCNAESPPRTQGAIVHPNAGGRR
jgi:hypothetical protein